MIWNRFDQMYLFFKKKLDIIKSRLISLILESF